MYQTVPQLLDRMQERIAGVDFVQTKRIAEQVCLSWNHKRKSQGSLLAFDLQAKTKMISDPGFVGIEQHASNNKCFNFVIMLLFQSLSTTASTWENHAMEDWVLEAHILVIAIQRAQEELGIGIQRRRRRTIHSCCCWDILFRHCWFCVLLQEAP